MRFLLFITIITITPLLDQPPNPFLFSFPFFFFPSFFSAYDAAAKANTPFKNSDNVMAVLYSVYSALFGSTSVVFAKLLAGFVTLMTEGLDVSGEWFFYVTFFAW